VVAEKKGHGFHEVYRTVPSAGDETQSSPNRFRRWRRLPDGRIRLPEIRIVPTAQALRGMALVEGGDFTMGDARWRVLTHPHPRTVESFYLATAEMTVGESRKAAEGLISAMQHPDPPLADDEAAKYVTFGDALDLAEKVGLRLPTEAEFEYAATNGGRTTFPWGDDVALVTEWSYGPVGEPEYDATPTNPPLRGLYSNVAEWTLSRPLPYPGAPQLPIEGSLSSKTVHFMRTIRGGPPSVVTARARPEEWSFGPRFRVAELEDGRRHAGLGFRGARSIGPRYLAPN
ncbi:MAG: SUMF1/EgtB/PvdO family nonheme iron enzyme, partial [Planctomycetes bacterium]|nr:SUMF1/EgtB/PvdO family nonheme iron enzyme [Planctomycetota bacterium]